MFHTYFTHEDRWSRLCFSGVGAWLRDGSVGSSMQRVMLPCTVADNSIAIAAHWGMQVWCQITFGHGDRAIGSVSRQSALYGGGVVDWWLVGNVLRSRLADDWRIEPWLIAEFSDKENSQLRTCLRYSDVHSIICKEMRPSQFTANLHRHRHGMNGGHLNTGCDLLESS